MALCKNGTDTDIYNDNGDDEDNNDHDDDKKTHTDKRGLSIHTSFPCAVKQIKGSVYSFPVR